MAKKYNTAIVGATGLVGRTMLKIMEERKFPVNSLKLLASEKSTGEKLVFRNEELSVEKLDENSFQGVEIALFSAGSYVSEKFAPIASGTGCTVIDNGSFWRMDKNVPLVVPEVNPGAIKNHKGIIANPNCSTIQMVTALKPIYDKYGINRIVCSTYQSISGAGQKGVDKLMNEIRTKGFIPKKDSIAYNTIFHPIKTQDGFTVEEIKMMNETRKIFNDTSIQIAVTCVRLPLLGGHGESLNLELKKSSEINDIRQLLKNSPGIVVTDDPQNENFPTVAEASGKDDVLVGRLRKDDSCKNGLYMWITADNLRKGAATNAVQIAELLINK